MDSSTCQNNAHTKSTVMVFWDRETKSLTCNLPEPSTPTQIATLEEFKSKLKSIEGTLGDTLDKVFEGTADDSEGGQNEDEDIKTRYEEGVYEDLNEEITKLKNEQILHSKQIQKLSEINEERTANESMLRSRISEIENKINSAYELLLSPTECESPTQQLTCTKESGYLSGNYNVTEEESITSHEPMENPEAIPFDLEWDEGKCINVEIEGRILTQKAQHGYCLLDKLISIDDPDDDVSNDVTPSGNIIKWTISIRKLEGEVGLGITKLPIANMSDNIGLSNREAFGESTIMFYCKSGYIYGGCSEKRQSNIRLGLGDNVTFRFDPINRTLLLQKNDEDPVLIEQKVPKGQFYPVATFYKPLDHC